MGSLGNHLAQMCKMGTKVQFDYSTRTGEVKSRKQKETIQNCNLEDQICLKLSDKLEKFLENLTQLRI